MIKQKSKETSIMPDEKIIGKIYFIRGKKVMFDKDLATLYGVQPKALNQAVKRNSKRFPDDFMFKLNKDEMEIWKSQIMTFDEGDSLRSQIVTLKAGRGEHRKFLPYVFTEQGVSMLSSILSSDRAIQVNIQIMRTFTKLREMLLTHKELREKIEAMERKYDNRFKAVFDVIKRLLETNKKDDKFEKPEKIGFKINK
jgi:hypothetical protein